MCGTLFSAITATRSPAATPAADSAEASLPTRSSAWCQVRVSGPSRKATASGVVRAKRASWSLTVMPAAFTGSSSGHVAQEGSAG